MRRIFSIHRTSVIRAAAAGGGPQGLRRPTSFRAPAPKTTNDRFASDCVCRSSPKLTGLSQERRLKPALFVFWLLHPINRILTRLKCPPIIGEHLRFRKFGNSDENFLPVCFLYQLDKHASADARTISGIGPEIAAGQRTD